MSIRNVTKEDLPFLQEKLGLDWMSDHVEEISYEKSIASINVNNEIEAFIIMKESSLKDYFNGHIPEDEHVQRESIKNHVAIDAEYFTDNQYEVIAWYSYDNSPRNIDNMYRVYFALRPIMAWAIYEQPFPFTCFYNLNDKVYVDIPPTD